MLPTLLWISFPGRILASLVNRNRSGTRMILVLEVISVVIRLWPSKPSMSDMAILQQLRIDQHMLVM